MNSTLKAELYRTHLESLAIFHTSTAERLMMTAESLQEDDAVKYQLVAAAKAREQQAKDLMKIVAEVEG